MTRAPRTILVTGAGGFVGLALTRMLVARGDRVRHYSRRAYRSLAALGVEQTLGELDDTDALSRTMRGCDSVAHVAARAGVWGTLGDFWRPNVLGTRSVISACLKTGISRLVVTSSPSVVFHAGGHEGADEHLPYPAKHGSLYSRTKAIAEKEALAANSPSLAVTALRPHLVWGPGDPHLLPRLYARARAGRLVKLGSGGMVDTTCVANAAHAHVLALDAVAPGAACAGRAYFIANDEPTPLWELIDRLLAAEGLPPVSRTVPVSLARAVAAVSECLWACFPLPGEPPTTRFVVEELSASHWYSLAAARRDLGYQPIVTLAQGLAELHACRTVGTNQ